MNGTQQKISERLAPGRKWILLSLVSCIFIFIILKGFYFWLSIPPRYVVMADAGFKKAKMTIDSEKMRTWALMEIAKGQHAIPDSEIPDYIQKLYDEPVEGALVENDAGTDHVELIWGGGFFHWGFSVGSTNYFLAAGVQNTYTMAEWVPGIYYGREDTAHKIQ